MKMLKHYLLAIATLGCAWSASAQSTASETHTFQIKAEVNYRCFGGNPPKSRDSRTQVLCDNKDYHKVLFNERVSVQIKREPTPDNNPSLVGDLTRSVAYQGRKFDLYMGLSKDIVPGKPTTYSLRTIAEDDEPGKRRQSEVLTRAKSTKEFSPLTVKYLSMGQPEEIVYTVTIEPAP